MHAVAKKAGFCANRRSANLRSICPLDGNVSRQVGLGRSQSQRAAGRRAAAGTFRRGATIPTQLVPEQARFLRGTLTRPVGVTFWGLAVAINRADPAA